MRLRFETYQEPARELLPMLAPHPAVDHASTGFLEAAGAGSVMATPAVASEDTRQRLSAVAQTKAELEAGQAADIASSITLVWACMEALPRILTGAPRIAMSIRSHMLAAKAQDDSAIPSALVHTSS
jgi:hypothetical protein